MTWPHFDVTIDEQGINNSLVKKTITPIDDPYSLVRSDDTIQVPSDFQTYMFTGLAGILTTAGGSRLMLAWYVDNAAVNHMIEEHTAGTQPPRIQAHGMMPLKAGQTLQINALNAGLGNIAAGSRALGFFLPLA
jgi:hypothetical protein